MSGLGHGSIVSYDFTYEGRMAGRYLRGAGDYDKQDLKNPHLWNAMLESCRLKDGEVCPVCGYHNCICK